MEFLEKDLEEIIYNAYKKDASSLNEKGLFILGHMKRQLRIGNYGVADLVTFQRSTNYEFMPDRIVGENIIYARFTVPKLIVTVYELKKDKIGISAYLQSLRYIKGIQTYLNCRNLDIDIDYKIVLIGKELDVSGSFCFLPDFNMDVEFYTYNYGINGIKFKERNGYVLSNNGFKL